MSKLTCVDSGKVNLLLGVFFIAELINYHIGYGVKVGNVAAEQLAEIKQIADIKRCEVIEFKVFVNGTLDGAFSKRSELRKESAVDIKLCDFGIERNTRRDIFKQRLNKTVRNIECGIRENVHNSRDGLLCKLLYKSIDGHEQTVNDLRRGSIRSCRTECGGKRIAFGNILA